MLLPFNPPLICPQCKAAGRDSSVQFDTGAPNETPYRCDGEPVHVYSDAPTPPEVAEPSPVSPGESAPLVESVPEPAPEIEPPALVDAMTPPPAAVQVPDGYELVRPAAAVESGPAAAPQVERVSGGELGMPTGATLTQMAVWSQLDAAGDVRLPGGDHLVLVRISELNMMAIRAEAEMVRGRSIRTFLEQCLSNIGVDIVNYGTR